MREPAFWWRKAGLLSALLAPLGAAYGAVAAARMNRTGARAGVPVLCVGNFTLGGAGKTPTAIALAEMLHAAGRRPFFLSRGYGGSEAGPKLVDVHNDAAAQVGDEPLLLARIGPTVIARDRVAGAAMARAHGADVIVMDDGLQNGTLTKNFTLAVIDGRRGVGNARVFPAGPLRAPLDAQLARVDALLVIGNGSGEQEGLAEADARQLPVFHGRLTPDAVAIGNLKARKVLAFAGIGNPDKFFATADDLGLSIAARRAFPDHHRFTAEEAAALIVDAEQAGLALLTTEKDHARMRGEPALAALAAAAHVLPVKLAIDESETLRRLVFDKLENP
ncbi:tetraacyldisaccharide 4'-kinase [Pseudolabrys taiwanensis]|uniref:Tetraacyldisaccharide 4'-kinase n=1 Tax=Pseudolabrys taiwanensis TaxID=331696 RepID=A0A346A2V6_9HYPH|nr:tetraacyldisaccharide 4'-kinase [Pseudolabrys taiwanensis]AXK83503.1 tetraacyldisaccharide 4'-kinase [Pseudolabrys taiwanensis]